MTSLSADELAGLQALCSLFVDEFASFGGGVGEDAVVEGEEGKLEAVGDAGFVVDAAEIVLDDLLFGVELEGDLFVFAALDDEGDDLHFFGGEAVADAGTYGIHSGEHSDVGVVDVALAAGDATEAVDQVGAGDVAADDAFNLGGDVLGDLLVVFGDEDAAAAAGVGAGYDGGEIELHGGGEDGEDAAELVERGEQAGGVFALRDDAHVVFDCQDAGRARTKDGLIVRKDETIHGWSPADTWFDPQRPHRRPGVVLRECLQFVQGSVSPRDGPV